MDLDELLGQREKLNVRLQAILDKHTAAWGVKVTMVEVKQVDLAEQMIRAIARQAEAERERRAKIIHAEGEYTASEKLSMAAEVLQRQPAAIQLRYLQTLIEIGTEPSFFRCRSIWSRHWDACWRHRPRFPELNLPARRRTRPFMSSWVQQARRRRIDPNYGGAELSENLIHFSQTFLSPRSECFFATCPAAPDARRFAARGRSRGAHAVRGIGAPAAPA